MIVRDEEKILLRCLKSMESIANELIVVDTGSKDNTISIAKEFGAKIYYFRWCDDFAAARNESLKHATNDWILQVDADEELLASSISPLKIAMFNPWCLAYVIKCDDGPTCPQRFGWIGRLFRNHPGVRYSRPYHETVRPSVDKLIGEEPRWQIRYEPNIIIRHYGYEPSKIHKKYQRGIQIMKSYLKEDPNDAYILTKLGDACYNLGHYDEAEAYFNKALQINPDRPETNYGLGLMLEKQGEIEAAIKCYRKATAGDPHLAEAYAHLGAIYIHKGMLDNAISELRMALATNPDLAWVRSNLGLAYTNKGMLNEGVTELKKALAIDPDASGVHMHLGMVYTKKGMLDEAIGEYKKALMIDPDYAKAHYNLSITYYKKPNYREAIKHCDRAIELGARVHPEFLKELENYRQYV